MFPKRYLVTSHKYAEYVKTKYPNRVIEITPYCSNDEIYYTSRKGVFHQIDMKDKSIWKAIIDDNGFPTGMKKRIR